MKDIIDKMVKEVVDELVKNVGNKLESIILFGSYTAGKISEERPNVNMLIITKNNVCGNDFLKIGEIFYDVAKNYKNYFSVRVDSLPFRFGFSTAKGREIIFSPNILNIAEKHNVPAFGIPHNVLEGMKKTRKVVFGKDHLADVNTDYTRKQLIQWALFDIGILFRNILIRAPLSYDVKENIEQLVNESMEIGKMSLMWGTEIYMSEEDFKNGKSLELINNKDKMVEFYKKIDEELGEAAKVIIDSRNSFQEYKNDYSKALNLYNAAHVAVTKVYQRILEELK